MPLGNVLRQQNIIAVVGTTSPTESSSNPARHPTTYIALSITPINPDGTGITEPSGNGYERIPTRYNLMSGDSQYLKNFGSESPTYDSGEDKWSMANTRDIYWREAKGSWGTIAYFGIYDSASGGSLYAYGTLANAIQPTAGTIPVIRAGDLVISD